ncbi:tripartite motif-containing protein 16-like [Parambassis ranga]|uniref:Tripartite motif-containing protein 16-like n=1 Tax=Parambassis ranga TaxID=210632 RepID=A0A6P7JAG2_9TELE|nr:tripartite motif-containing protein 16-like [Parambassis ranga]
MAHQQQLMDKKKLCCPICLDLLKDPVTIPCGHSYCMNCIKKHWDEEGQKETHSCPQCRQIFTSRPALVKNTILADLLEELEKTGLQAAPADHCFAGSGDVACDFCTGRKLKAVKSCLQCLVSYCELHLQPHYESPAFEKHKLIKPSQKLRENTCPHHGKEMKIFCRSDQQCICIVCSLNEHQNHDTVLASVERGERQKEVAKSRRKIQQRIQERGKDLKVIQQKVEAIDLCADKAVKNSEKIITQLFRLIKTMSTDVKQHIRLQQKNQVSRAKALQENLQKEISELKWKEAELEELTHTEDHTKFLHIYSSLACLSQSTRTPCIDVHPPLYFDGVVTAVSEVRDKLQGVLSDVKIKISSNVTEVTVLRQQGEPTTRAEFLQHSQQLTLDTNTANLHLVLTEGNRKATVTNEKQSYTSHPDRFTDMFQVLSRESLSGQHYWEVERGSSEVSVAVTYKDIRKSGYESGFGNDDRSWALECFSSGFAFRHNGTHTSVSGPQSSRIGVYLDHDAGTLSFYSVSDTMTLLHRVQTTFNQPLHQGLGVFGSGGRSAAEVCLLEKVSQRLTVPHDN